MNFHKLKVLVVAAAMIPFAATLAHADVILAPGSNWEYTFADPTGAPTWNTTIGGWSVGPAPFGNNTGLDADFGFATLWAADGSDGDDLWVRVAIDLTGYDLGTVIWDLGVDNGFTLYANGAFISAANAEGYTYRWEYSGAFGASLVNGINIIAVALEDHGGATAFDMQVSGRLLPGGPGKVPEPGMIGLLGLGLLGAGMARRRRKAS